ncbi:Solute carrier organic anion transporter family member 4A1 [Armadillidium vulgare]|nr:Solute carrier organic anion transporter family member 4A1 [Armadillidium vulgare]
MPKLFESQFGFSAGFASLLVGFIAVPAGGGGTFLGGWLVKRFQLKCDQILKFCISMSFVCSLSAFFLLFSCPEVDFAGVNVDFANRSELPRPSSLESACNMNCSCNSIDFDPVCGSNNVMYYSPCHAGCHSNSFLGNQKIFSDCECIRNLPRVQKSHPLYLKGHILDEIKIPEFSSARQKCPSKCTLLPFLYFNIRYNDCNFSYFNACNVGCVPDTHRSLALGLQGIQIRIFGTIPGPILFGLVLDNACSLWQTTCRGSGSCRHYNNSVMSRKAILRLNMEQDFFFENKEIKFLSVISN